MKKLFHTLLLSIALMPALSASALAKSAPQTALGNDISYPQCSKNLPSTQAFGVVGVNGGLANNTNPCLAKQLSWAGKSPGLTYQQKAQLYVNTGNPGGLSTPSWPSNNIDSSGSLVLNPYGTCDGSDSLGCAWQYGWNRALEDVQQRLPAPATIAGLPTDPKTYFWWLDVETINTWKSGSSFAQASNAADLEGMAAYFKSIGTTVGLYSTTYQWGVIAGTVSQNSNLNGLVNWRPGARDLSGAKKSCSLTPLTNGGKVTLTQFISKNLDYDYSCI